MKAGWCLDGLHDSCRSARCECPCGAHPRAASPVVVSDLAEFARIRAAQAQAEQRSRP